jgi:hypothetical protein
MMVQMVQTMFRKGVFHWTEKSQEIQCVNPDGPDGPNGPMKFVLSRDHEETLIRESCIGALSKGIAWNPLDLLDRLDQSMKSIAYENAVIGPPLDRIGPHRTGRFWVLPKVWPSRGSRSSSVCGTSRTSKSERSTFWR